MKNRKYGVLLILFLLFSSPLLANDILFVSSGMINLPWTTKIKEGLEEQLTLQEIPYSLYEEHLDISRLPNNDQNEIYYQFLSEKFKNSPPDICVLAGNAATELFTTYPDLFPLAQKISIESHIETTSDMTIINLSGDYTETIEEIKRVAEPEHIYIIGDSKIPSRLKILKALEETVKLSGIAYTSLADLSYEDLVNKVSKLSKGSVIFFTPIAKTDTEGNHLVPLEVVESLSKHTSVPIFSTSALLLDHGVVGGYISDPRLLGVATAQLIAGQTKDQISNGFAYYYDWDLVEHFGFKNKIHDNSFLLHKSPTFYELYTSEIYIFISFLIIFIFLFILLITINRKLSRAKIHISNENLRLEKTVEERTKALHRLYDEAAKKSKTDALTGLNNRRAFFSDGNRIHALTKQIKQPYSILMLDIDKFKTINDNFGHSTGDEILKLIAQSFTSTLQSTDISARLGGEEFVVLLQKTSSNEAFIIAENIRKSVEDITFISDNKIDVHTTISIGLAEYSNKDTSIDDTLSRADKALYIAKEKGRNQVCFEEAP